MPNENLKGKSLSGIIVKLTGGFYYVEAAGSVYECKARGSFRRGNISPVCGDRVEITVADKGYCSIDRVEDRKNHIIRPALANVDNLVIVVSTVEPVPNAFVIDKMTAMAESKSIEPIIVFTKTDIKSKCGLEDAYKKAGFNVFCCSMGEFENSDAFLKLLDNKITAFTGNSGVGKSTLLNTLLPGVELETGDISQKLGRGRHTTRTVEFFKLGDGYVVDTPGFSTVDIQRYELIYKDKLPLCFREFKDYIDNCRFTSCTHTCEKGCAVLQAVKDGEIPKTRHESYVAMYNEIKDIKEWELK